MGVVFVAHDLTLERKVAIKLLATQLMGDPELVARFEREARLTASLEHPNIVAVYAVGNHEGRPFIVMKKLEGQPLSSHLRDQGAFKGDTVLHLMRQLCSGLELIHNRGFIHRDIKASNVFVGSDGHATLLDFGILRSVSSENGLTRAGMAMGTPHYMSPEQAMGVINIDHRSDLYALAILLYECLTGTLPFQNNSELSIIQMHAHEPPPSILDRAPWVPLKVAAVVMRGLSKKPEDRYPTAKDFVQALEAAFVPVSFTDQEPALELPAKSKLPFIVLGVIGLSMAVGLSVLFWPAKHLESPSAPTVSAPAKPAATPVEIAAPKPPPHAIPSPVVAEKTAHAPKSPIGKGKLKVVTTKKGKPFWSSVTVNGKREGVTPLMLDLPAGTYRIGLVRSGFNPIIRKVKIENGHMASVHEELTR